MIVFKFISTGIKQNLGLGCSKYYFRDMNKKKLYIIFVFWPDKEIQPPRLTIKPPLNLNI